MSIVKEIDQLMRDTLAKNQEEAGALVVDGIVNKFVFYAPAIANHRERIRALLNELPVQFHFGKGDGWSFLQMPMDKNGAQWGEQRDAEMLYALGAAAGMAKFLFPRDMWSVLPGAMPYIGINTAGFAK